MLFLLGKSMPVSLVVLKNQYGSIFAQTSILAKEPLGFGSESLHFLR